MKLLRWLLLLPAAIVVLSLVVVNFRAAPIDDAPLPSRSMVIEMPDGSDRTLGELVDAARAEPSPSPTEGATDDAARPSSGAHPGADTFVEEATDADPGRRVPDGRTSKGSGTTDLIELAEFQIDEGRAEAAIALLRSVPKDHPRYGFAMRRIGWDCYTRGMNQPGRGVAYVNASLWSDPWSGNAWQDAYRVYLNEMGLRVR